MARGEWPARMPAPASGARALAGAALLRPGRGPPWCKVGGVELDLLTYVAPAANEVPPLVLLDSSCKHAERKYVKVTRALRSLLVSKSRRRSPVSHSVQRRMGVPDVPRSLAHPAQTVEVQGSKVPPSVRRPSHGVGRPSGQAAVPGPGAMPNFDARRSSVHSRERHDPKFRLAILHFLKPDLIWLYIIYKFLKINSYSLKFCIIF